MKFSKYFFKGDKKDVRHIYDTINLGIDFLNGELRGKKVLNYKDPQEYFKYLSCELPEDSISIDKGMEILKYVGENSIAQFDLNYLAFPDAGNSLPGLMGSLFTKFLNQNMCLLEKSSPVGTVIEIQTIHWFRELVGYKSKRLIDIKSLSEVGGMWTTGGHMSNHVGILAALNDRFPELKEKGLANLGCKPVIFFSTNTSHYSIESAVHHLGIGKENIMNIPCRKDTTSDFEAFEKMIISLPSDKRPFLAIIAAGNTKTSGIDNIMEFSKICKKYGVWLHVDACHGGSLLFSKRLKNKYMRGLEEADSVSIDPHKGLFVTYPSSFVLFKKTDVLSVFSRYPDKTYEEGKWELAYITPFLGSRGFESLSIWFLIKVLGKKGLTDVTEYRLKMALYVEKLIKESGMFVALNKMQFYRMAFVYLPTEAQELIKSKELPVNIKEAIIDLINKYNKTIDEVLYESGKLVIDQYSLFDIGNCVGLSESKKYMVLAVAPGNPQFTKESLSKSLSHLFKIANKCKQGFMDDLKKLIATSENQYKDEKYHSGPAGW